MGQSNNSLDARVYFGSISVLVVESGSLERNILVQVMQGFKARTVNRYGKTEDAMRHLDQETADLLIVGTLEGEMDAYAFVRWLRQSPTKAIQTVPIILLTGHTQQANVIRARDCGASFVVAKPITPQVLYGRVEWLARDRRNFVVSDAYTGPDRRFQALGPPAGMNGRRTADPPISTDAASGSNLSQANIDAMLEGAGAAP